MREASFSGCFQRGERDYGEMDLEGYAFVTNITELASLNQAA